MTTVDTRAVPAPPRSVWRALLTAPFRAVSWRAFGYLLVRLPLAAVGVALLIVLVTSVGLSLTVVGIPLVALVVLAGRYAGVLFRGLTSGVLGVRTTPPARFRPRPGPFGWIVSALGDLVGWRAIAYGFASLPVVMVGGYAVVIWIGTAFGGVTYPIWWWIRGVASSEGPGGQVYRGLQIGRWHADTWPEALLVCAVGLVLLWVAPWLVRGVVALDVLLQRWLLAGGAVDRRVAALEAARADVVEDAAATLRRVERDLHDGTQAQLVAMAMTLDRARGRLAAGDVAAAGELLDGAHGAAKEALTDLREVVRRIHPPVLDQGLVPALHTLTSRCPLPVRLDAEVPARSDPGVETIAYFCVAELLNNAVRHSRARAASVAVVGDEHGALDIEVGDDGVGGAVVASGNGHTGLAGLAQRVAAVDGVFSLSSPPGGPTVVRVQVPAGVGR